MTRRLKPPVAAWVERGRELTVQLGLDLTLPISVRRQQHRDLSDILFGEFGTATANRSERREHMVPVDGVELRLREYRPRDAPDAGVPAMLTLHGGGFWHGTIDEQVNIAITDDRAAAAGVAIFALEYRLAPEAPFPVPGDDAVAAARLLFQDAERLGIDAARIIVGGTSAGANLAVLAARTLGATGLPLAGLLLEVPAADLRDRGTWLPEYAEVNGLGTAAELRSHYAPHLADDDPAISPVVADDLGLLPPTHIMTAELDPLRDGGELLAERIGEADVVVSIARYADELHGSSNLTAVSAGARSWHADATQALRRFAAGA